MNISTKLLQAAAGSAGGAGLDVDEVFSTFLYTGNGTAGRTITNNIDISTEGGLIWTKARSSTYNHTLGDTANGVNKYLYSNTTADVDTSSAYYSAFNTNGYVIGDAAQGFNANELNANSVDYVSWTFRKQPKFFDVVTYTGNGNANRTVSHNLNATVGAIFIKCTSHTGNWSVWHRGVTSPNSSWWLNYGLLSSTNAFNYWGDNTGLYSEPTSTSFVLGSGTNDLNASERTYVAYLFAHNNDDGEFGPSGDQDIIKCGSYTTDSSGVATVDLGFEPQWIMYKTTGVTGSWVIVDVMRGIVTGGNDSYLLANSSNAEVSTNEFLEVNASGFKYDFSSHTNRDHIYMAIRRGPLAAPEDATKVFNVNANTVSGVEPVSGFVTDFAIANYASSTTAWYLTTRLQGNQFLSSNATDAEATINHTAWDRMDGAYNANMTGYQIWHWKRAPSYFDVVAYSGTGSARTVAHNLGVVPEMIWIKCRSNIDNWAVFHKDIGATKVIFLNSNIAAATLSTRFNDTAPTSSVFTVGTDAEVNGSGRTYIAYLFATVAGVSKVGSYTGDGTAGKVIDCGFSSGARFVLIKESSDTGGWFVYDTTRGIVAGNDPYLHLDSTNAENTSTDSIDPNSSGFAVNYSNTNANGQTYIFYAIA